MVGICHPVVRHYDKGVSFDDDERPDQGGKRGEEFRESESAKKKKKKKRGQMNPCEDEGWKEWLVEG